MARKETCVKHQSCDCIEVEEVLDAAEEDEVLSEARSVSGDLRIGGWTIEALGPVFEAYAPILHRLADDLEEIVAHLRGQRRYTVRLYHGTVFAEDEQEAVMDARLDMTRRTDHDVQVEHRPLLEPRGPRPDDPEDG